ncbi:MAG: succinate--CoA ligase subunit alpha [Candidatus Bathyarchaeota archaeon]|nr:succinate--CoA ligase subunit alpha [Candidatus Bathyarchaeota archaeon]
MGILVDSETRAIVQGITGVQGSSHAKLMLEYGTRIVAGTSPGKGGVSVHGVPVYDTVQEALKMHKANAAIVFVPAPAAVDAALETLEGGIKTVVVITEHVPVKDAVQLMGYAKQVDAKIAGPNTPGVITPGKCKLGILPSHEFTAGKVGVVSRSGTLTYEIAAALTRAGVGQSTCLGVGGDPVTGLNFIDALEMFRNDPETEAVALVGEIGGNLEELTAEYIAKENYPKPVVAYVAGRTAPVGRRMGHAGAIVRGKTGTAKTKIEAFENAGVKVAEKPSDVAKLLSQRLRKDQFS